MVEVRRSGPGMPNVMGDCWASNPDHLDGRRDVDRQQGRAAPAQRSGTKSNDVGSDAAFTAERQQEAQRKFTGRLCRRSPIRDVGEAWERLESNPNLVREIERGDKALAPSVWTTYVCCRRCWGERSGRR